MAEATAKKIKIYKLATELNLSSETLIEFLHKKGFEVKSHMSTVTDDMLSVVMGHFKKEKTLRSVISGSSMNSAPPARKRLRKNPRRTRLRRKLLPLM